MIKLQANRDDVNKILDGIAPLGERLRITSISERDGIGWILDCGKSCIPALKGHFLVQNITDFSITLGLEKLGTVNKWIPDSLIQGGAKLLLNIPWIKARTIGVAPLGGFLELESASTVIVHQEKLREQFKLPMRLIVAEVRHSNATLHIAIECQI